MSLLVFKFGGTSVGNIDRINLVASKVAKEAKKGHSIIVIVSAMAGVTNQLVEYCTRISELTSIEEREEYDAALSSGEQVTSALLSLALLKFGLKSRSFQGWQLPITTNSYPSKALIENIDTSNLVASLNQNQIPIIAGFQGVNKSGKITTLGRGGSDTTAAAIAAAIKADRCDIFTDVDGVYTTDPRMVHNARKLDNISYEEMLEFASMGAKVLHPRSVQIAMRYDIPLRVLSTFKNNSGTNVKRQEDIMEQKKITGISYNNNIAFINIKGLKDTFKFINILAHNNINLEMIIQTDKTFNLGINLIDISRTQTLLKDNAEIYESFDIMIEASIISLIGYGMHSDSKLLSNLYECIEESKINVYATSNSEIKFSFVTDNSSTEKIIKLLHSRFELDK